MAIDPEKFGSVLQRIEKAMDKKDFPHKSEIKRKIQELQIYGNESRPPRMYVFGRSGSGKSSLINALANKNVADTGAVRPETVDSQLYNVEFKDQYSSWEVVDSRGLFESVSPDGSIPEDTVKMMRQDLKEYKPDLIIHVLTPDQARAGKHDFETIENLRNKIGDPLFPPVIYCLNKVDTLGGVSEWPPDKNAELADNIRDSVELVCDITDDIRQDDMSPVNNDPLYGYRFDSDNYLGIIPTYLRDDEDYWNIIEMSNLIGDFIPDEAKLQFMQSQRREKINRRMARSMTRKVSSLSMGVVGNSYIPGSDIFTLTPIQMGLIIGIGSLSGEEISMNTAHEYVKAMSGNAVAGYGFRLLARNLIKFVPAASAPISATIAGAGTYAVGRSAEKYFFDDEIIEPDHYFGDAKDVVKDLV